MKINKITLFVLIISFMVLACDTQNSNFGLNGSIEGKVTDKEGSLLHGGLSNDNLIIKLLGEGDTQAIDIRVDGDGTYKNTKIFPKEHKVWVEGAIVKSDTIFLDFENQPNQRKDFSVTPLISSTALAGSTNSSTSINVEYTISTEAGVTVERKELYCSTVRYPTADIGSQDNIYFTKTVSLPDSSGEINVNGLESGQKYYIRIGAKAQKSSFMNYSNQIEITL